MLCRGAMLCQHCKSCLLLTCRSHASAPYVHLYSLKSGTIVMRERGHTSLECHYVLSTRATYCLIAWSTTEGRWRWMDGSLMPLPTSAWSLWYPGQPDNTAAAEHCSVLTNYQYWTERKQILDSYAWVDLSCDFLTANEIQGYICESKLACMFFFLFGFEYCTRNEFFSRFYISIAEQ